MKKSYIAVLLIVIVAFMATKFTDTDTPVTATVSHVAEALEAEVEDVEADEAEADEVETDDDSDHSWGNPNTLPDHFERHGADFDAKDAQDYARQAHKFYENRSQYQIKNDNGVLRIYDSETNTFGAYNKNGTTRTFYKPNAGQAYFDRQPGN